MQTEIPRSTTITKEFLSLPQGSSLIIRKTDGYDYLELMTFGLYAKTTDDRKTKLPLPQDRYSIPKNAIDAAVFAPKSLAFDIRKVMQNGNNWVIEREWEAFDPNKKPWKEYSDDGEVVMESNSLTMSDIGGAMPYSVNGLVGSSEIIEKCEFFGLAYEFWQFV